MIGRDEQKPNDFSITTHWDIVKKYKRLIIDVVFTKNIGLIDVLMEVYNS